ncbi:hypothetical protein T07_11953 [Trichinella nelsoni]|uniref:Uncharacterized protein n=1 Tax=Trichinella nelsoni TaxID=6336 RepID=A0A0V0SI31_9BILA|nr:hypothetical protein T07_11953 [Trichinella nelsoni]
MNYHNCNNQEKWIGCVDVLRGVQISGSSVDLALTPLATTDEKSVCAANVRCRGLSNDMCALLFGELCVKRLGMPKIHFSVQAALHAPVASCITHVPKFRVIFTLCWILLAWERTFCAFRLVWSSCQPTLPSIQKSCDSSCCHKTTPISQPPFFSAFGKVVIATFGSSIYVVHGSSEGGHLLMVSDTLDKEPEFIVVHQPFLIGTNSFS